MKIYTYKEKTLEILPYILFRYGNNEDENKEINLTLGWLYFMIQITIFEFKK